MGALELFVLSVLTYTGIPLGIALLPQRYRLPMFYGYIASVLTVGGLLGAVYVIPLGNGVSVLAGQVSYAGFLFSTLIAVIVGRDVQVLRTIIVLVLTVNTLVFAIFRISQLALEHGAAGNIFATSPEVFATSIDTVLVGGLLIIVELVLILVVLEWAKTRLGHAQMVVAYLLAYVGALALDGVLFPTLVLRPDSDLLGLIGDQMITKVVLATSFLVPLLVFVLGNRSAVRGFEGAQLPLRQLLHSTRDELIERIDTQQAELADQRARIALSDQDAVRATATVNSILDAATDTLLLSVDADLRITAFNAGAEQLLGRSRSEVVGGSPADFHAPSEIARHAADLGAAADYASVLRAQVASGERRDWELIVGDDERIVVSLSITEIRVEGRLEGYVVAGVDITERLETELALQSALEIERGSLTRLREADGFKRSVVSTVSHELRTPISSILGYSEMMVEGELGDLSAAQSDALRKVRSNATRLHRIVDDLLVLDRVEQEPLVLDRDDLDLRDVVRSCLDAVEHLDHTLVVDLPDTAVPVSGDLPGLERVTSNLIGNAVKFTPGGGTITITVAVAGAEAHLQVTDTGIGIAPEDQTRLFDRFFRAEEATSLAIPGSGLGLSIVHALVTHHEGRIEVDSTPGRGTAMTVVLPLSAPGDPGEPDALAGQRSPQESSSPG